MVDVIVTTAGGIEEDLIKCLAPTFKGDFALAGAYLRSKGLNRIGNLLVPNDNYCKFEDWIVPIFDQMLKEQIEDVSQREFKNVVLLLRCSVGGFNGFFFFLTESVMDSIEVDCSLGEGDK